jgi:hypothetical protein
VVEAGLPFVKETAAIGASLRIMATTLNSLLRAV